MRPVSLFAEGPQQLDQPALYGEMDVFGFQARAERTGGGFSPNGFKAQSAARSLEG